jgi:hypothetical protein
MLVAKMPIRVISSSLGALLLNGGTVANLMWSVPYITAQKSKVGQLRIPLDPQVVTCLISTNKGCFPL